MLCERPFNTAGVRVADGDEFCLIGVGPGDRVEVHLGARSRADQGIAEAIRHGFPIT
jgi:hypothetical protein